MTDLGLSQLVEALGDLFGLPFGHILQGSGQVASQARALDSLTGVNLMTIGEMHITLGDREALVIEAEDNLLPYLESKVADGQLDVRCSDGIWLRPTRPVKFYLTVQSLDSLTLAGSGKINAPDFQADRFCVRLTGSGDIHLGRLDARAVRIKMPGSGKLHLAGSRAERQDIALSGSGHLQLDRLEAQDADVRITGSAGVTVAAGQVKTQRITLTGAGSYAARDVPSDAAQVNVTGSGSATISVRDRIEARVTGSGSVHYAGQPTVEKTVLGSGRVYRIDEHTSKLSN